MKKLILALALCLVLVVLMAAPVAAAVPKPPKLTFDTHITSDGYALPGNLHGHFTIKTNGVPGLQHVIGLTKTKATPQLADDDYALTLQADASQQTTLTTYFSAMPWWADPAMQAQMAAEIAGTTPFFFLRAVGGVYSLVDNFRQTLGLPPVLTIDDDYPTGTYVYTGTLTGNNTATLDVTVTLVVVRAHAKGQPKQGTLAAVDLGTAGKFAILAKSGISTTGTTSITGDIGVSPIAATAITGFGLIKDASDTFSTSSLVTGKVYAADYADPTPAKMTTAVSDMETAYTDAAGRTDPTETDLGAGAIGGLTLAPGLYKWGTGVTISSDVTLSGGKTAVWIFQIAGTLTVSSDVHVILSGGAKAENIFWQVTEGTSLGTTSVFNGNILDLTLIAMGDGATLNGRALAQTAVTLIANHVVEP
jgi:hypothetical protein